jgi:hypothetical protein
MTMIAFDLPEGAFAALRKDPHEMEAELRMAAVAKSYENSHFMEPVFIVVCRDTRIAGAVHDWLTERHWRRRGAALVQEPTGQEVTVRIPTKVTARSDEALSRAAAAWTANFIAA